MKYASIIPLIGGESLGIMEATNGQLPEYVLSYSPFKNNDSHYIQYIREKRGWTGDYVFLDEDTNYKPAEVDVVNSVCPCAGLSSLSVSSSANSAVNDWLYTTAEYVLSEIGPKVFWGENAPRLYTSAGAPVADRLYEIGQRYGYSLNLYYTESRLHGLAQKRPRTFYFFTRSERAPIFPWHRREFEPVERIFERAIDPNDPMNIRGNNDDPMDNPWLRYCMHKTGSETIMDYFNKIGKSTNCIVESDRGFDGTLYDVADWMRSNGYDRFADRAVAMQKKLEDGKGYWAHGITMGKGEIPSLIGAQPHYLINAYTGQTDFGPSSYVKQNNKSQVYSSALTVKEESNTEPLDAFFHLH